MRIFDLFINYPYKLPSLNDFVSAKPKIFVGLILNSDSKKLLQKFRSPFYFINCQQIDVLHSKDYVQSFYYNLSPVLLKLSIGRFVSICRGHTT